MPIGNLQTDEELLEGVFDTREVGGYLERYNIMILNVIVLGVWLLTVNADLDQTYSYFHNSHFMEMAVKKLRKCDDPKYKRDHRKDCDTVEYLNRMKSLKRKLSFEPERSTKSSFKVESTDAPYATYFENYVINNK